MLSVSCPNINTIYTYIPACCPCYGRPRSFCRLPEQHATLPRVEQGNHSRPRGWSSASASALKVPSPSTQQRRPCNTGSSFAESCAKEQNQLQSREGERRLGDRLPPPFQRRWCSDLQCTGTARSGALGSPTESMRLVQRADAPERLVTTNLMR